MSTLQVQLDRARTSNNIDTSQYTAARALEDANIIIHQIEDYITSAIWEWYFWDIMTVDTTVVDQSEYRIPTITSWNFNWTPKIEWISIQYDTDWEFIPATERNRQTLLDEHDLSWYEINISEATPIYFIADDSVFIYPAPTTAIAWAIKYYGIKSLADAEATTDYDDLFGGKIPTKYYYMIAEWMEQYILKVKWEKESAKASKQFFEDVTLPNLVEKLWNRKPWISQRGTPDLSKYEI